MVLCGSPAALIEQPCGSAGAPAVRSSGNHTLRGRRGDQVWCRRASESVTTWCLSPWGIGRAALLWCGRGICGRIGFDSGFGCGCKVSLRRSPRRGRRSWLRPCASGEGSASESELTAEAGCVGEPAAAAALRPPTDPSRWLVDLIRGSRASASRCRQADAKRSCAAPLIASEKVHPVQLEAGGISPA